MTSKLVVNTIESDAGVSTVTFAGDISVAGSAGALSASTLSASTLSATNLTVNGNAYPNAGPLSNRNKIINGDMRIDQRNAGASVSTHAAYTVDRFAQSQTGGGDVSWARSTVCPDGFTNSLGATVTTADSSIAAGDYYRLYHYIEGFNAADFNFGSAAAQTITLSFWVRSSVTGTYCIGLQNGSYNRSYAAEYTISTANTWEHKTITITGDTSGTWATDNTAGVTVFWDLGTGSSYNQTANTWVATNTWKTSSQTSWIATSGATFYITGVQLEVGSVATPFEHRSYGQELALCQRYCQVYGGATYTRFGISSAYSNTAASVVTPLSTPMRTLPSITTTGNFRHELPGITSANITVFTMDLNGSDTSFIKYDVTHTSNANFTGNKSGQVATNNDTTARFILSAEL